MEDWRYECNDGQLQKSCQRGFLKLQLVKGDATAVHTKTSLDAIEQLLLVQCTHRKRTTERKHQNCIWIDGSCINIQYCVSVMRSSVTMSYYIVAGLGELSLPVTTFSHWNSSLNPFHEQRACLWSSANRILKRNSQDRYLNSLPKPQNYRI